MEYLIDAGCSKVDFSFQKDIHSFQADNQHVRFHRRKKTSILLIFITNFKNSVSKFVNYVIVSAVILMVQSMIEAMPVHNQVNLQIQFRITRISTIKISQQYIVYKGLKNDRINQVIENPATFKYLSTSKFKSILSSIDCTFFKILYITNPYDPVLCFQGVRQVSAENSEQMLSIVIQQASGIVGQGFTIFIYFLEPNFPHFPRKANCTDKVKLCWTPPSKNIRPRSVLRLHQRLANSEETVSVKMWPFFICATERKMSTSKIYLKDISTSFFLFQK